MDASVKIEYDIVLRRTVTVDLKDDKISEALSFDNASFEQLTPTSQLQLLKYIGLYHDDYIVKMAHNIKVTADYDDPDDINIKT